MREKWRGAKIDGDRMLKAGILALVLTLWSTGGICGVWAKYVVEDSAADSARAAYMSFSGGVYSVDLSSIEIPGDSVEQEIILSGKAEVSMRYRFGIELDGTLPLTVKVTKTSRTDASDKTILLETDLTDLDDAISDGSMPLTELGTIETLAPNTDLSDAVSDYKYAVTVEWPTQTADSGELDYPDLSDTYGRSTLTIGLYAEQVD